MGPMGRVEVDQYPQTYKKTSVLRLGILIDLDTAHGAHGSAMSYFHLPIGGQAWFNPSRPLCVLSIVGPVRG
jgi:hypothetical protein